MRGLYSALALCALVLEVTATLKQPRLRDVTRRKEEKINKAVHQATHQRLLPRYANATNTTTQFLTNTTASQSLFLLSHHA